MDDETLTQGTPDREVDREDDPPPPADDEPDAPASAEHLPDAVTSRIAVSAGLTARSIALPTAAGMTKLDTGLVPAVGVRFGARLRGDRLSLELALAYHSSIAAKASQAASDAQRPPLLTSVQTHHFAAGLVPRLFLGDGADSATLGLFLGYGVRALASVVELRVPRFSLHGPVARLELELPLGSRRIVLRIAPEAQLILFVSRELRTAGGLDGYPWTFGGEASLRASLSDWLAIEMTYREAHATLETAFGESFEDVERFALLGVELNYF